TAPFLSLRSRRPPSSTLFPYTTLFRSQGDCPVKTSQLLIASAVAAALALPMASEAGPAPKPKFEAEKCYGVAKARTTARRPTPRDRKSTRLNSSHVSISYAVFCLKKKK